MTTQYPPPRGPVEWVDYVLLGAVVALVVAGLLVSWFY